MPPLRRGIARKRVYSPPVFPAWEQRAAASRDSAAEEPHWEHNELPPAAEAHPLGPQPLGEEFSEYQRAAWQAQPVAWPHPESSHAGAADPVYAADAVDELPRVDIAGVPIPAAHAPMRPLEMPPPAVPRSPERTEIPWAAERNEMPWAAERNQTPWIPERKERSVPRWVSLGLPVAALLFALGALYWIVALRDQLIYEQSSIRGLTQQNQSLADRLQDKRPEEKAAALPTAQPAPNAASRWVASHSLPWRSGGRSAAAQAVITAPATSKAAAPGPSSSEPQSAPLNTASSSPGASAPNTSAAPSQTKPEQIQRPTTQQASANPRSEASEHTASLPAAQASAPPPTLIAEKRNAPAAVAPTLMAAKATSAGEHAFSGTEVRTSSPAAPHSSTPNAVPPNSTAPGTATLHTTTLNPAPSAKAPAAVAMTASANSIPSASPAAPGGKALVVSSGVVAGNRISGQAPTYPSMARAANIQGTVVLEATITRSGRTSNLRILSGPMMLRAAALEAVRNWRYKPYLLNGQPIDVQTAINVVFSLNQ